MIYPPSHEGGGGGGGESDGKSLDHFFQNSTSTQTMPSQATRRNLFKPGARAQGWQQDWHTTVNKGGNIKARGPCGFAQNAYHPCHFPAADQAYNHAGPQQRCALAMHGFSAARIASGLAP